MNYNALQALVILQQKVIESLRKVQDVTKPHFWLDYAGYLCIAKYREHSQSLFHLTPCLDGNLTTKLWNNRIALCISSYNYLDFGFAHGVGSFRYFEQYISAKCTREVSDQREAETMIDQLESIFKTVLDRTHARQEKAMANYQIVVEFCAQCREMTRNKLGKK